MDYFFEVKVDRFSAEDRARILRIQRFLKSQRFELFYDRQGDLHRWRIVLAGKIFACEIPESTIQEHGFSSELGVEIAHTILNSMLDYLKELELNEPAKLKLWFSN